MGILLSVSLDQLVVFSVGFFFFFYTALKTEAFL